MTTATLDRPSTTDTSTSTSAPSTVGITQYSRRGILAIWAAAALPMGALAWIVAPAVADGGGAESLVKPLLISLTVGLVWQFVLAMGLVGYEQRTLRWSRVRHALWLQKPRSPRTGRVGGRVWFVLIPLVVLFGLHDLISLPVPAARDFGEFVQSDFGKAMFDGSWGWFGLFMTMAVFNTVLGEELLFRGVLLPRMNGAFGDRDWVANGLLFTAYHLHVPWAMPAVLIDTFAISYPVKRFRSAWLGIAVHSAQTVVIGLLVLTLVV